MAVRLHHIIAMTSLMAFSIMACQPETAEKTSEGITKTHDVTSFTIDDGKEEPKNISVVDVQAYLKSLPETVAEIDGQKIGKKEFETQLSSLADMVSTGHAPMNEKMFGDMRNNIFATLVTTHVLLRQADKESVNTDPAMEEDTFQKMKKQAPDEDSFKKALAQRNMTVETLRAEISKGLRIRALLEKNVISTVTISEEDARKYYDLNQLEFERQEERRLAHILVSVKHGDSKEKEEAAREKIGSIRKRIVAGEKFADLAKELSADKSSAGKGGDLGFVPKGKTVPDFEKAAFALAVGEMSGAVKTRFGYHLIKVLEQRPAGMTTFEEAKGPLMEKLKSKQTGEKVAKYIVDLKEKMKVKTFIN